MFFYCWAKKGTKCDLTLTCYQWSPLQISTHVPHKSTARRAGRARLFDWSPSACCWVQGLHSEIWMQGTSEAPDYLLGTAIVFWKLVTKCHWPILTIGWILLSDILPIQSGRQRTMYHTRVSHSEFTSWSATVVALYQLKASYKSARHQSPHVWNDSPMYNIA